MPHLLPKTANKIQPASRKSKREFFRRENTKCTFSSRRHLCFRLGRQAAQSPTLPGRLHIPFRHQPAKISRLHSAAAAANPSIAKCFFLQLRFSRRENTRCIFFQHPKPSFPAWTANISRCQSYYNLQQDNSLHSGASRPTPPAALLFIPALTILNQPTSFLPAWPADALHSSPPFFQNPPIAIFPAILPVFVFPYLQLQSHLTTFPIPSTSSVLLPLLQPAGQTRNVVSRAGAACKAADGAGEEPAFLFFFFLFFSSFPSSFPSPWRRGFAATPSFFFLFLFFSFFLLLFLFLFFFLFFLLLFLLFYFCFFLFIFLLIFILVFLCPFFLLFLSFYFCFYLCFLYFFLFVFSFFYFCFFSLCLSFCSLFIFAFIFVFCLSFCFTFLPSLLQSLSSLSNRSPTIHFFYSAANLSNSIQPLPGSSKNEKNIGKRIHGGEMASRERTGGGRKDRGTEWSPERDGKKCILRGMEQWAERNEWREEID